MRKLIRSVFLAPLAIAVLTCAQQPTAPPSPPEAPKHVPRANPAARPAQVIVTGRGSYLGVDTRDVTSDRVGALKLKEERGVEIVMVDQDAPAGKAGIHEQDVILTYNGQNVDTVAGLR